MTYKTILFEIKNSVATIKINRPKVKNALCMDFFVDLKNAIQEVENYKSLKLVLITGNEDSFASGADLNEVVEMNEETAFKNSRDVQNTFQSISALKVPVLAAINGYCMGGGLELAMFCDIRIASETALFALPESKIGICPGGGGTQLFTDLAGIGNAMHYLLSGKTFDAKKALQMGIVSDIFPLNSFEHEINKLVKNITSNSMDAVLKIKELVQLNRSHSREEALIMEAEYFSKLITTSGKEGMKAFLEKRKPNWN